jgi:hypothetical protein
MKGICCGVEMRGWHECGEMRDDCDCQAEGDGSSRRPRDIITLESWCVTMGL